MSFEPVRFSTSPSYEEFYVILHAKVRAYAKLAIRGHKVPSDFDGDLVGIVLVERARELFDRMSRSEIELDQAVMEAIQCANRRIVDEVRRCRRCATRDFGSDTAAEAEPTYT